MGIHSGAAQRSDAPPRCQSLGAVSVDRLARVVVDVAVVRGLVQRARPDSAPARVVRDVDHRLAHVVRVVGLRKLVAEAGRVLEPAGIGRPAGDERGIHGDPDGVPARRDWRLPVSAVEDEHLSLQLPDVHVGPSVADALVARHADAPAIAIRPGLDGAVRHRRRRHVDHAEAALGGPPDVPRDRVDQLVPRVVAEMEVPVAGGEFVETVVVVEVHVRVADEDIGVADVGRRDREANHPVRPGADAAFDRVARGGEEVLVAHDPVVLQRLRVDDQIRRPREVRRPVTGQRGQGEGANCEQDLLHGGPPDAKERTACLRPALEGCQRRGSTSPASSGAMARGRAEASATNGVGPRTTAPVSSSTRRRLVATVGSSSGTTRLSTIARSSTPRRASASADRAQWFNVPRPARPTSKTGRPSRSARSRFVTSAAAGARSAGSACSSVNAATSRASGTNSPPAASTTTGFGDARATSSSMRSMETVFPSACAATSGAAGRRNRYGHTRSSSKVPPEARSSASASSGCSGAHPVSIGLSGTAPRSSESSARATSVLPTPVSVPATKNPRTPATNAMTFRAPDGAAEYGGGYASVVSLIEACSASSNRSTSAGAMESGGTTTTTSPSGRSISSRLRAARQTRWPIRSP